MVVSAYLFEAKGIQRYLFMAGKLRDVVGASDLVSRLASSDGADLIGSVCESARVKIVDRSGGEVGEVSFSRRAGGAFCLHGCHDDLIKVRALLRLAVMSALPGLEFSDAFGLGGNEIDSQANAVEESGGPRSNMAGSVLPLGRPVFEIVPTTGLPRISQKQYRDNEVALDQIQLPLRLRADALQQRMGTAIDDKNNGGPTRFILDGVAKRFHCVETGNNAPYAYPRNLSDEDDNNARNPLFPWVVEKNGSDYRMALVHADVSGLGEAFQNLKAKSAFEKLEFAKKIEQAINKAVQGANRDVLVKAAVSANEPRMDLVPARPLVIGGDDMTILVRADLALEFTVQLLKNIETETKGIAGGLSACAGVAIANRTTPFLNLHELAESLCKFAKKSAKSVAREGNQPYPSMLAFHHQTQTAFEDYIRDVHPCLTINDYSTGSVTGSDLSLTANPYEVVTGTTRKTAQPTYDQLMRLAKTIRDLGGATSAVRQIEGYLAEGKHNEAQSLWFRLITRPEQVGGQKAQLEAMFNVLMEFGLKSSDKTEIPFTPSNMTPLFDAISVIDFGRLAAQISDKDIPDEVASAMVEGAATG